MNELSRFVKESRRPGAAAHAVVQTLPGDWGKNAAYRDWLMRLKKGEQLPRGKFFRGKRAGVNKLVIVDEMSSVT